jgi:hypothetical protein
MISNRLFCGHVRITTVFANKSCKPLFLLLNGIVIQEKNQKKLNNAKIHNNQFTTHFIIFKKSDPQVVVLITQNIIDTINQTIETITSENNDFARNLPNNLHHPGLVVSS